MIKHTLRIFLYIVIAVCVCDLVRSDTSLLRFRGQVLMPDGTPATKAELTFVEIQQASLRVPTDKAASFEFSAPCLGRAKLIAKLPDGSLQRCIHISATDARAQQATPIQISLQPAQQVQVKVTADNQPLGGVRITTDEHLLVSATTNDKGTADLLVPGGAGPFMITAWHPTLGTSGIEERVEKVSPRPITVNMELKPIGPQLVQVLDENLRPVPNLPCAANGPVSLQGWFRGSSFKELTRTTNPKGLVEFNYVYRGTKVVEVELLDYQWVLDRSPAEIKAAGMVPTIQVRQRKPVTGKLIAPAGTQLDGLFVIARSNGPFGGDHIATARADKAGYFTISLAPGHCYMFTVEDQKWSTDPVIGIFSGHGQPSLPKDLRLFLKPTVPFTIIATAGQENAPIANAQVITGRPVEWVWIDQQGL